MTPIAGAATLMSDCGNENLVPANPIKKRERIARKDVAVFPSPTEWPPRGRFENRCDCMLKFKQKALSSHFAALPIPSFVLEQLLLSFEVKPN